VAIERLQPDYHRDRGVYLARQSRAFAGAGEPEHAAVLGFQARAVAAETRSARILTELTALETAVGKAGKSPTPARTTPTFTPRNPRSAKLADGDPRLRVTVSGCLT
jgi:hypothetical protein